MTGMFEVIAKTSDEETERISGNRARVAATETAKQRFVTYLASAGSDEEFEAKVAMVETDLRTVVTAACAEHGYDNPSDMFDTVVAALRAEAKGAQVADGDTSTKERVDVASGPDASPPINKDKVPEGGLDAVQVPSKAHPNEQQSIVKDRPDFEKGAGKPFEQKAPMKTIDASEPIGEEGATGTGGTFGGGSDSAVTSAVEAHWSVLADGE